MDRRAARERDKEALFTDPDMYPAITAEKHAIAAVQGARRKHGSHVLRFVHLNITPTGIDRQFESTSSPFTLAYLCHNFLCLSLDVLAIS